MARILIIDDEAAVRRILNALLSDRGDLVVEVGSGEEALDLLKSFSADLVMLDLSLPGIDGIETLRRMREQGHRAMAILMTAFGTVASAVEAMRLGAFDYLTKPFQNEQLLLAVTRALELHCLSNEVESLRTELESAYGFTEIIGVSAPMKEVFRIVTRVAPVNATVLITGESGTGKEMVARAIHCRSPRAAGPFAAVNCSAIPQTLIESELFGHEKGAFTDAQVRRAGRFEEADRGTLFLDEVGDLSLDSQAKILRALQERQITPVGGRQREVDVRVIAATNKNLAREVKEGRFREDLFWRLNVVPVKVPPLRERKEDLPLLFDHFLERFRRELGLQVKEIAPEARRLMLQYDWPGNVRELENTICRSMILCYGHRFEVPDLPARIREQGSATAPESNFDTLTLAEAMQEATERLEKLEKVMILSRLAEHRGNRTSTAASLGISRKTLFNKLRQYQIGEE